MDYEPNKVSYICNVEEEKKLTLEEIEEKGREEIYAEIERIKNQNKTAFKKFLDRVNKYRMPRTSKMIKSRKKNKAAKKSRKKNR